MPPRPRLGDVLLETYFLIACGIAAHLTMIKVLRDMALDGEAPPQIPAWLAAEYRPAVGQADPDGGAASG